MRRSRELRLGTILALGAAATLILAAAASAGQAFQADFHSDVTNTETNFCGVAGLTVTFRTVRDGRVHVVPHGRDRIPYFLFHARVTEVVTNVANSKSVTAESTITDKDLRVTDNEDGTMTVLVLATGNGVLYGGDGKAIARNPGQVRFEILVDDGGAFLAFLGVVKESTGRSDDFCEAAVPALT